MTQRVECPLCVADLKPGGSFRFLSVEGDALVCQIVN